MGKAIFAFAAVLLFISLSSTVCAKEKKSDQITALDNAFKAGVLTREEYKAKKAALQKSSAPGPTTTGQPNVDAVKPQNPPSQSGVTGGRSNYYRMKKVQIIDQHGFERPMTAVTLLIPTDWQFQPKVQYLPGGCGLVQTTFRATGPDGRSIELLPEYNWQWSDDASTVQFMQAQRGGCDVMRPMSAADFLRKVIVPKVRPARRLVGMEPIPKVAKQMQEMARQTEAMSAQAGLRMNVRSDVSRARLQYTHEGRAVEGWVTAVMLVKTWAAPTYDIRTMRPGQALYYASWAQLFDLRAPQGQLDASEKLFETIASTIRFDPQWQSRVAGAQSNIAAANIKGAADRSKIITKSNAEISNMIIKGHEERSKAHDRAMANYSQALRGVETYRNPNSGETVELSNQYGHAWVNNNNEYILSDQEGFDPNLALKSGNWTALQRVKP